MIRGEKVYLQAVTKEDSLLLYNWVNQARMRDLTGTVYPVSEFEHESWIKQQLANGDQKLFMICCAQTGRRIGVIGLRNLDWINRNAELFIRIGAGEEYTAKGYGCDAVKTFVTFAFTRLNLHKIYLHVFVSNKGAVRCYEKAGFQKEGELKEHHFSGGAYETVLVMSVLSR